MLSRTFFPTVQTIEDYHAVHISISLTINTVLVDISGSELEVAPSPGLDLLHRPLASSFSIKIATYGAFTWIQLVPFPLLRLLIIPSQM